MKSYHLQQHLNEARGYYAKTEKTNTILFHLCVKSKKQKNKQTNNRETD